MLESSQGDFYACWNTIDKFLKLQHTEIKASLEESIIVAEHRLNIKLLKQLRGLVSKNAMRYIVNDLDRVNDVGIDSSMCGCINRTVYGLPCTHELAKYVGSNSPISINIVHPHWKKLDVFNKTSSEVPLEITIDYEIEALVKRFKACDLPGKIALKSKIRELAFPITTSIHPPIEKVRTKGRPLSKKEKSTKRDPSYFEYVDCIYDRDYESPAHLAHEIKRNKILYIDCFPREIQQYIDSIIDVKLDGHCGFRAITSLLLKGDDSWAQIRHDLRSELQNNQHDYEHVFGYKERIDEVRESLICEDLYASRDKWMTIPDMGHLIASRYNVVLVHLSKQLCLTFLPLRGAPLSPSSHQIIAIGFVNNNHFGKVFMKEGSPIPPVPLKWKECCDNAARSWEVPYVSQMNTFNMLVSNVATKDIIYAE